MRNGLTDRTGLRFWIHSLAAVAVAIVLMGRAGGQAAGGVHVEIRKATTRGTAVTPSNAVGQKDLLYVLDTNNGKPESQVLLLDTSQAEILQTFKAGHMPDMALSPDGASLYVNSSQFDSTAGAWHHWLETFDAATANSLGRVSSPDTLIYTAPQYPTKLAVSRSGRRLFILRNRQTTDNDDYYIATFDTEKKDFLPGRASIPGCVAGLLLPGDDDSSLDVICGSRGFVSILKIGANGDAAESRRIVIRQDTKIGLGFPHNAASMSIVTQDGTVLSLNRNNQTVTQGQAQGLLPPDRWLRMQSPILAGEDRNSLFFANATRAMLRSGSEMFDQILQADPDKLTTNGSLDMGLPFYSLTANSDGSALYAIAPDAASVMVIDPGRMREIRRIESVGVSPTLAIPATRGGGGAAAVRNDSVRRYAASVFRQ